MYATSRPHLAFFSLTCFLRRSHSNEDSPLSYLPKIDRITVDNGIDIFYRYAGRAEDPVILLLHGFPTSSHQYRRFVPHLASAGYRVIAPDFPGYGFTSVPDDHHYEYTFENLALTTSKFLKALDISSFAVYIFDYGAPVAFRLATSGDFTIKAIISQNGNAYEAGLGEGIQPLLAYGRDPSAANEAPLRAFLSPEATKFQYVNGSPHPEVIEPETYTLDSALLARPGNDVIQLSLFKDYINNVNMYPKWQAWLRENQPPVLAIWGKNDIFFIPPGAEAYKQDVKDAEVVLVDGGHLLLETDREVVAEKAVAFLKGKSF